MSAPRYTPNAHAAGINTGDTIRAVGLPENSTDPIEVIGEVEEIDYELHSHDELGAGSTSLDYGFTFAVRPAATDTDPEPEQILVWVYDSGTHNVTRIEENA